MSLALIVHGGAREIPAEQVPAHRARCLAAVRAGWEVLARGGEALDAVEAAIRILEDDPTFNAGYGSELNAAGHAEMDAALMEGGQLQAGAVAAVQGVKNPIEAARRVLESEFVLLVGDGAREFARENDAELCAPEAMIAPAQRRKWEEKQADQRPMTNTVGCVAIDARGRLACGTSTGGTGTNPPGRVGDSPLVGCGLYADDCLGAASLTGEGEQITRVVLAKTAVDLLGGGTHPDEAAQRAIGVLEARVGGEAGCILIDRQGRIGWAHNAADMACAYFAERMAEPLAFINKREEQPAVAIREAA